MARLLSVNVGLPNDVTWNGKTVRTSSGNLRLMGGEWCASSISMVMRKPIPGHGGEHRAVFVYQMDSYHYWERILGRNDFTLVSLAKTSRRKDLRMTRSALEIDIASAAPYLR